MKILNSTITNVTVFNDRAQVYRLASVDIEAGEHIFRFDNLPSSIEPKSIQINGKGNALLKNIKFKEVFHEEITDEYKKGLKEEAEKLILRISELESKMLNTKKERDFVENIANKIIEPSEKGKQELNPENWIKMIDFYRQKLNATDKEIFETNILLKKDKNTLERLNNEIASLGRASKKTKVVDVILIAEDKISVKLYFSYIVYGAAWIPTYNARVWSETKKIQLEYNALITQNTGENWENAGLKLSTAQVQIGGSIPELSAWYVNIYKYIPNSPSVRSMSKKAKELINTKKERNDSFGAFDESEEGVFNMPAAEIAKPKVTVAENINSVVFIPQGKYTINSDNQEHSATIMHAELEGEFDYTSVPKLSPYAYLKAKAKNASDFPLLQGDINIFLNNNFVAESYLQAVFPDEEFILSLGVDESIKIKYKQINKFNKHEGVFSKKNVKVFEYETIITNTKKTVEKITLKDNIPVSQDDKIKVSLIIPKIKENTDELKVDESGIVTRVLELKPETEIKQELKFEVEFPQEETVTSL